MTVGCGLNVKQQAFNGTLIKHTGPNSHTAQCFQCWCGTVINTSFQLYLKLKI